MKLIGIDLGGTNLAAGLIEDGVMIVKITKKTNKVDQEIIVNQLIESIEEILERANLIAKDIDGVGIAVPGWTDAVTGIVYSTPNIPLKNLPLVEKIQCATGIKTYIENDANCAALGEFYYGAAAKYSDLLFLTIGTGLGGGVILNNRLLKGVGAGEVAHVVINPNGPKCGCGRCGCTETYTSATAFVRIAKEEIVKFPNSILANEANFDGEKIFDAYYKNDEAAVHILDIYTGYFAEALFNFLILFGSIPIIIGGGIAQAGESLFSLLREKLNAAIEKTICATTVPTIGGAMLGNDAGIFGAAALFEEEKKC